MGSAPIVKIARRSGFTRSTCEAVLETLEKKNFVVLFRKKNVRYFSAEDPHKIILLSKQKTNMLERVLPQLLVMYGSSKNNPTVRHYQGKQGMKLILEEMLNEAKELKSIGSAEDLFKTLENYPEFVKKRLNKKIPIKVILRDSKKARERKFFGPQELRQVKIISANYEYQGIIYLWNNKVAMFSFEKDLSALVVDSKAVADMQNALFEYIWDSLPN